MTFRRKDYCDHCDAAYISRSDDEFIGTCHECAPIVRLMLTLDTFEAQLTGDVSSVVLYESEAVGLYPKRG